MNIQTASEGKKAETSQGHTVPTRRNHVPEATPESRSAVERKAQQFLGPDLFASEFLWNAIGFWGGVYWLLWPIREQLQAIGRKFREDPPRFWKKYSALVNRHFRKLASDPAQKEAIKWFTVFAHNVQAYASMAEHPTRRNAGGSTDDLFSLPPRFSQKNADAATDLLSTLECVMKGQPQEDRHAVAKKVIGDFVALAKHPGGCPPKDDGKRALEIKRSGKYSQRTLHCICIEIVPGYLDMPSWKRDLQRRRIHAAMKRAERRSQAEKTR
jgi:hypothetical protein